MKSPGQMLGYFRNEEKPEGITGDGFLKTGDMGEMTIADICESPAG